MKKYNGHLAKDQFAHVYEIWDQELALGNALKTVERTLPNDKALWSKLQNRVWNMRQGGGRA